MNENDDIVDKHYGKCILALPPSGSDIRRIFKMAHAQFVTSARLIYAIRGWFEKHNTRRWWSWHLDLRTSLIIMPEWVPPQFYTGWVNKGDYRKLTVIMVVPIIGGKFKKNNLLLRCYIASVFSRIWNFCKCWRILFP